MADTFEKLTIDEQRELLNDSHQNLLPEDDVSRESDQYKRNTATAGAVTDLHAHIDQVDKDVMPDKAKDARLDRWGDILQLPRKGGTQASAENAGKVRGSNGSSWTTSDALVHTSGRRYFPTSSGTLGSSGEDLVGIISENKGSETLLEAGEILTWESTPSGLEDEVELQADLTGGKDKEGNGAYRDRLLTRLSKGARGGTAIDFQQWALESADHIATAYVWPNRNGKGSVDVAGLKDGRGSARLLDASERSDLLDYLNDQRPVTAGTRVLEVQTESQNVEVKLQAIAVEDEKDWNDSTPPTVSSWDSGTRKLTFGADRPSSMGVGDRLVVDDTSGEEQVIESLSGTDAVILKAPVAISPSGGENVYAGGPLVTPVRDAILALLDALGPREGKYAARGMWVGTLRLSALFKTVQTTEGVLDSEIVTPSADVEPTEQSYPDDDKVNLLVPGNVVVRYA